MVRRVGFGNSELPEDIGETPDDTPSQSTWSRLRRDDTTRVDEGLGARLFSASFLGVWLVGWTAAIAVSTAAFLTSEDSSVRIFLGLWITAAVFGWWLAAQKFFRILRGKKT